MSAAPWLAGLRSSPDGTFGETMTNLPFNLTLLKQIARL
jgi:hypothetical protein